MLFNGLNQNNYTEVVVGSIVIAVFAIAVNWILERLQTRVLQYVSGLK